jgi:hypothetical protein
MHNFKVTVNFFFSVEDFAAFGTHVLSRSCFTGASALNHLTHQVASLGYAMKAAQNAMCKQQVTHAPYSISARGNRGYRGQLHIRKASTLSIYNLQIEEDRG